MSAEDPGSLTDHITVLVSKVRYGKINQGLTFFGKIRYDDLGNSCI